jgi:hypothetical protein
MSNREAATFILVGVLVLLGLTNSGLRRSILSTVRQLVFSKLVFPFAAFLASVVCSTWLAHKSGLWSYELVSAEIIWFFSVGFAWFLRLGGAGKDPDFFRRRLLETVGIGAFFEFFINIASLPFVAELLLQVVLVLLGGMIVVASMAATYAPARTVLQGVLALIIGFLVLYTFNWLITSWSTLDKQVLLDQLLLPVWLTVCAAVCFFPLVLLFGYEVLFLRMSWMNDRRPAPIRARLAVVVGLRGSWVGIDRFDGKAMRDVLAARTFGEAREVIRVWRRVAGV